MKVTLLNITKNPSEMILVSKNTRLNMHAGMMQDVLDMSDEQKQEGLEYASKTIRSSWEFVDFTFLIEGVSRAFTHQFVRNRQGSYAQQTMRILDVDGFDYITGPTITGANKDKYDDMMYNINKLYNEMIENGVKIEDARGILPTNICTNIMVKYNLRTLVDLVESRSSPRTQGEFREVLQAMYSAVVDAWPDAKIFLDSKKKFAASELDKFVQDNTSNKEDQMQMTKMIDMLRK